MWGIPENKSGHAQVVVPEQGRYFGLAFARGGSAFLELDGKRMNQFTTTDPRLGRRPDLRMTGPLTMEQFQAMQAVEQDFEARSSTVPYHDHSENGENCLSYASRILQAATGVDLSKINHYYDKDDGGGEVDYFDDVVAAMTQGGVPVEVDRDTPSAPLWTPDTVPNKDGSVPRKSE